MPEFNLNLFEALDSLAEATSSQIGIDFFCHKVAQMLQNDQEFAKDFAYIWTYQFEHLTPYAKVLPATKRFSGMPLETFLNKIIHQKRNGSNHVANGDVRFASTVDCTTADTDIRAAARLSLNIMLSLVIFDKWIKRFKTTNFNDFILDAPIAGRPFAEGNWNVDEELYTVPLVFNSWFTGPAQERIKVIFVLNVFNIFDSELMKASTNTLLNNLEFMTGYSIMSIGPSFYDDKYGVDISYNLGKPAGDIMTTVSNLAKFINIYTAKIKSMMESKIEDAKVNGRP